MATQNNPKLIKHGKSFTVHSCTLEIDGKGVIWVHDNELGKSLLRICRLPTPIPNPRTGEMLDITHMYGTSFGGHTSEDRAELLGKIIAEEFARDNWGDIEPDAFANAFQLTPEDEMYGIKEVLLRVIQRLYELEGGIK